MTKLAKMVKGWESQIADSKPKSTAKFEVDMVLWNGRGECKTTNFKFSNAKYALAFVKDFKPNGYNEIYIYHNGKEILDYHLRRMCAN